MTHHGYLGVDCVIRCHPVEGARAASAALSAWQTGTGAPCAGARAVTWIAPAVLVVGVFDLRVNQVSDEGIHI